MNEKSEWTKKAEISSITKKIVNNNTGENVFVQGDLDSVLRECVLITRQDITCKCSKLNEKIRHAVGIHIIKKSLTENAIKGVFVEIIATDTTSAYYIEAARKSLETISDSIAKCVSSRMVAMKSCEITIWITR